ncbi:MAG: hypothetical protein ACLP22_18110 [Solirubrobacteraceae bacterium]
MTAAVALALVLLGAGAAAATRPTATNAATTAAPTTTASLPTTTASVPTTTTTVATTTGAVSTPTVRPAPGSSCGQTITVQPQRASAPAGPPPLAVGDSVLYDAAPALSYYGFESNAMVCRTMSEGIAWLQQQAESLPRLVVVALGTNGPVSDEQIDQLLSIVGPHRILAMVTPHNGSYAYVPGLIRAAAQQHPGRIEILDWDQLSAGHPNWFAPDGIHLGGTAGIDAYAQLVASALLERPTPSPAATATMPTASSHGRPRPRPPRRPRPVPAHPPDAGLSSQSIGTALVTLAAVEALSLAFVGV